MGSKQTYYILNISYTNSNISIDLPYTFSDILHLSFVTSFLTPEELLPMKWTINLQINEVYILQLIVLKRRKRVCIVHGENFIKLPILRSSRILTSNHRIDPDSVIFDEINSENKLLQAEFRLEINLWVKLVRED